jgi:aminoglycoside 3-N-acetyltransferase
MKGIIKHHVKKLIVASLGRGTFQNLKRIAVRCSRAMAPRRRYSASDLVCTLEPLGLTKGSTVFVHSSWDSFYTFDGKASELIQALLQSVGNEGTLAMPAFPADQDPRKVFDVKRIPSGGGYLTEIFRRSPNVKRSINLNHSVCGIGPNADYLLKDHHRSATSWDEFSPYYRLREVDATIVGLGVGRDRAATALHCVESILRREILYFSMLFPCEVTYTYRDENGNVGEHTFLKRVGSTESRRIFKHFDREAFREVRLSNLRMCSIAAKYMIDRGIELGRQGITQYVRPRPEKHLFCRIQEQGAVGCKLGE